MSTYPDHSKSAGIHPGAYIRNTDPAVEFPDRMVSKILWIDVTNTPIHFKRRNDANNGWDSLGFLYPNSTISDLLLATPYIKADGTRPFTGNQSLDGNRIIDSEDPVDPQDLTTKAYVDSLVIGGSVTDEHIQDVVGAMIIGGTDINATYNDEAGTVTIDNTGGGSGGTTDLSNARPQMAWGMVYITKPPDGGSGGWTSIGNGQTFGTEGSATAVNDSDGFWNVYQSSFGGGTTGRFWGGTNYTISRRDWKPIFETLIKIGSDLSDVRVWCGLFSATPFASATPSLHYIAFRYATAVDGTAFWRCVTDNGSGTPTVTTTTAAIAVSTKYSLRFECKASDVDFYVNDVLVATHSTTLPTGSQDLGFEMGVKSTGGGSGKQFWINHVTIIQPR